MWMQVGQGVLERTVRSQFNRLHLLVSEITTQNKCVLEKSTDYHEDPTLSFTQQKNYFQLPHKSATTWRRVGDSAPAREELVTT
ncbi:hypothetical protein LAM21_23190, partial [Mycobacterium tuberculosis]|nr:hypothetical protein [Mycobacterium tuberculosis]